MRVAIPLALVWFLSCASGASPPAPASPEAPPAPSDGTAPRPYTAEQIRGATAVGRRYLYRVEARGQAPIQQEMEFLEVTPSDCLVRSTTSSLEGAILERKEGRSTWAALVEHARFPAAVTTISDAEVEVPGGTFQVWRYRVAGGAERPGAISTFDFAKDLPGAPVQMEVVDAEGVVMRMVLLQHHLGG